MRVRLAPDGPAHLLRGTMERDRPSSTVASFSIQVHRTMSPTERAALLATIDRHLSRTYPTT